MSLHVRPRAPRAHWVLLSLFMLVLLGGLCLNGFVDPAGTVASRAMPRRTIALTFDDGPDPQWTPKILDVLARHHAHATFLSGRLAGERPS